MAFDYTMGLGGHVMRKVSLAVRLIDGYTGKIVHGGYARLRLIKSNEEPKGQVIPSIQFTPIVKADGYHVFVNLPGRHVQITVGASHYHEETVILCEEDGIWDSPDKTRDLRLTPNEQYPLSPGAFYVRFDSSMTDATCYLIPDATALFAECGQDMVLRVAPGCSYNLAHRLMAQMDGDTPIYFTVGERFDDFCYRLSQLPTASFAGGKSKIYPVSLGRADQNGTVYGPLACFSPKVETALVFANKDDRMLRVQVQTVSVHR